MHFRFTAIIKKAGINPYVDVPVRISAKLTANRGYIPVKGKINGFDFVQNLVPVKNEPYRLFVNGPMLKGALAETGSTVRFTIEQDPNPEARIPEILPELKKALIQAKCYTIFQEQSAHRKKEVLKYFGSLKTAEAIGRNIKKLLNQLKKQTGK
jgi:hypothetical protein